MRFRKGARVQLVCGDVSLTQQHFRDMVDPKMIMERYMKTGLVDPAVVGKRNEYGDVSELPASYELAVESIRNAIQGFENLPVNVRRYYGTADEFVRQTTSDEGVRILSGLMGTADPRAAVGNERSEAAVPSAGSNGAESGAKGTASTI